MIHIALSPSGTVMAHFVESRDAAEYCTAHGYTHLPYNLNNLNNRDGEPAPLVGAQYRA